MHRLWGGEEIAVSARGRMGVKLTLVMCLAAVMMAAVPLGALPLGAQPAALPSDVESPDGSVMRPTFGQPVAHGPGAGAVQVSTSVEAVRLLVVGEDGRITAIYSNTGGQGEEGFSGCVLRARSGTVDGRLLSPIPTSVLAEYEELLPRIDWSVRGLVYSFP